MTIHYHGTPITPNAVLHQLAGRHFCVSFAAPDQVVACHEIGQSVMLDCGAFSFWRTGKRTNWPGYYRFCERWLAYRTTWAVIPDVIDGDAEANDALVEEWPFGDRGAPVWHMHEPVKRLITLAETWPRVCVGSSKDYAVVGSALWHARMTDAMDQLCSNGACPTWLHMLRGMRMSKSLYPFASVDSTDVARNHNRPHNTAYLMAEAWDRHNCPARWEFKA